MSWNDLILSVCSIILTGLATWGLTVFTTWMNSKLKDKKSQKYANEILNIVISCVKGTYQTYVEAIKGTNMWTKETQEIALHKALESAKAQLSKEFTDYITTNYGNVDQYLIGLIEAILYDLKK